LGPATAQRLGGLSPRQQNRDGAAIRHAAAALMRREAMVGRSTAIIRRSTPSRIRRRHYGRPIDMASIRSASPSIAKPTRICAGCMVTCTIRSSTE
jgi:hypothetical protein